MMTLAAMVLSAALVQDRPEPPRPELPQGRQEGPRDLEKRADELRARLEKAPEGSPERENLQRELRRIESELQRRRSDPPRPEPGRPGVPQPPNPPQPPRPEGFRPPFNPEEVRAWLRENEPETARRLAQLEGEGRREEVMRILQEAQGRMRSVGEMKERDPKAFERLQEMRRMERQSLELGERARRSAGEEKERTTKELNELLGKLFDLREEGRAQELAELKRRVEALEKAVAGRKANKDKIVEKRRKELLGDHADDEW